MHLVAISTDRLLAVTFPLRHGRIMKNYGLKIMLATMWVVAFAFATVRQLFVERRVALTLAIVIILFSVSWFPLVDAFFSLQENLWLKVMVQHTCELDLWLSLTLLWTLLFTAQEFETSAMPISRYPARCSVAELKMQTPVLLYGRASDIMSCGKGISCNDQFIIIILKIIRLC